MLIPHIKHLAPNYCQECNQTPVARMKFIIQTADVAQQDFLIYFPFPTTLWAGNNLTFLILHLPRTFTHWTGWMLNLLNGIFSSHCLPP